MTPHTQPAQAIATASNNSGTWTNVVGFAKVDGQPGIWLSLPNGDACYYEPQDVALQSMAFHACANPTAYSVSVCIPSGAPANGLIVSTVSA